MRTVRTCDVETTPELTSATPVKEAVWLAHYRGLTKRGEWRAHWVWIHDPARFLGIVGRTAMGTPATRRNHKARLCPSCLHVCFDAQALTNHRYRCSGGVFYRMPATTDGKKAPKVTARKPNDAVDGLDILAVYDFEASNVWVSPAHAARYTEPHERDRAFVSEHFDSASLKTDSTEVLSVQLPSAIDVVQRARRRAVPVGELVLGRTGQKERLECFGVFRGGEIWVAPRCVQQQPAGGADNGGGPATG